MANTYGDTTEPGIITEETSSLAFIAADEAPSDVCIVAQADLVNGDASANQVYEITRDDTARQRFGPESGSLMTTGILDLLLEGAQPVYAIATSEVDVVGEDISGSTGSGTLANAPVSEDPADTTFTVDATALSTLITYEDPSTKTPAAGEVYLNPTSGAYELGSTDSDADATNDTVDYTYFDYAAALDALETNAEAAEAVDFVFAAAENQAVQTDVVTTVQNMAANKRYASAFVSPGTTVDTATVTNSNDSSRVQTVYPSRFDDGSSALAAYAGVRSRLGFDRTAIGQRFRSDKRLLHTLDKTQRGDLIEAKMVPLENRAGGVKIVDDKTSISDTNTDEANINYGFKRMVLDYVYDTAEANEEPFIGKFNQESARNAFAALVAFQLTGLKESGVVDNFSVQVFEDSATQARLKLAVDAPDPIRFIVNDVTVGSMQ